MLLIPIIFKSSEGPEGSSVQRLLGLNAEVWPPPCGQNQQLRGVLSGISCCAVNIQMLLYHL